jgi:hypothetical protein
MPKVGFRVISAVIVVAALAVTAVAVTRGGGATASPAGSHGDSGSQTLQNLPATGGGQPSGGGASGGAAASNGGGAHSGGTSGSGAQGSGSSSATPGTSWFTVTLAASCVTPGGTETLTAQSRPGYTVAFNTRYSDGRTGEVDGGYGVLATDSSGRATTHWTVAATAPAGTVTLYAGTANGGRATTLTRTFVVAAHC